MGVGVAGRGEDRGDPVVGDAREDVPGSRGMHGVDRDLDVAVGRVLDADRHGQPAHELAMDLALGGARADGSPTHGVRQVLGDDRVEELAADGQTEIRQVDEESPRRPQALVDLEAAVEARIVDQPLPADGGTGLLEVHPHDDAQRVPHLPGRPAEVRRVLHGRRRVVHRARSHHDEQPIVAVIQDVRHLGPAVRHHTGGALA